MDPSIQAGFAALASFFVVFAILSAIFLVCRSRRDAPTRTRARTAPNPDLSSVTAGESASFDPNLNEVSMADLVHATRNFSPDLIIGDGSFGLVYKAKLCRGVSVAVKKLSPDAFQGFREFRAEVETLGKIRHPNIVRILGYCATGLDRVLIYEFVEKGSLDQWIYDTSSSSDFDEMTWMPLAWDTRIKIISGVARGLAYMHNLDIPIIHRDIKASNVLLDSNFEAHIADFGLARRIKGPQMHVSTQVAGTMGYMPPEYFHGAPKATAIGDVYSFGILMVEIVAGRRPNFPFMGEDGKEVRLIDWANNMVEQNRYIEMVDANISKDGLEEGVVIEYFKIAMSCANEAPQARPHMKEVVKLLDDLWSSRMGMLPLFV